MRHEGMLAVYVVDDIKDHFFAENCWQIRERSGREMANSVQNFLDRLHFSRKF
jgi:hypothetical protein